MEEQNTQLTDNQKAAIVKAFDVAVRSSNENAVQYGMILGEILVALGIATKGE